MRRYALHKLLKLVSALHFLSTQSFGIVLPFGLLVPVILTIGIDIQGPSIPYRFIGPHGSPSLLYVDIL
jgi:hypothetical protein